MQGLESSVRKIREKEMKEREFLAFKKVLITIVTWVSTQRLKREELIWHANL